MKATQLLSSILFLTSGILTAQTVTQTFSYTGSVQTFTVPSCVSSITIDCKGAQGGGTGGLGGRVQCTLPVNPGDVLNVYVGGQGGPQQSSSPGGFNGGGSSGPMTTVYPGAGGGGASDIRLNGNALTDRVIVAGGGGGSHQINSTNNAGAGGGLTGGNVIGNGNTCMATWATGGTQSAGGNPSTWSGTCCNFTPVPGGSFGVGGNGAGPAVSCNGGDGGAGGGGGWYGGGGGGTYTAGGGGSSYTAPSVTGVTHTQGTQSGNGQVIFTYNAGIGTTGAITGPSSVCSNSTYNYSITSVSGATSYLWTVPTGAVVNSGQGTTNISVTFGGSSGSITVTPSGTCGTGNTSSLTVTVNAPPVVNLGADVTQCGGTVSLNAQNPGNVYVWSTGATTQSITVSTSGTYSVTVTTPAGCTGTDVVNVTINPAPIVNLGADITQCGGSATLDAQNPGSTYVWSNSATTQTISVSTSGTYSVTVTDVNGCTGTDVINVNINTAPVVNLGADVTQCGGSVLLDGQNPGSTYLWSTSATTQTISVSASGTYSVTVTSPGGCTGTDVINITINPAPAVNLGADITQCGGTATLDAQNPGNTYAWSNSATTQTITVSASGTYSVVVTGSNGCTGTDVINVTINPLPTVTLAMTQTNVCITMPPFTLTGGSPPGGTYFGPGVSSGVFSPAVAGIGSHVITYSFTDVNGCTNFASQILVVSACTGLSEAEVFEMVNIYPNPSSGMLYIAYPEGFLAAKLTLTDMEGRIVYSTQLTGTNSNNLLQLDLSAVAEGVYSLRLADGNYFKVQKFVISK